MGVKGWFVDTYNRLLREEVPEKQETRPFPPRIDKVPKAVKRKPVRLYRVTLGRGEKYWWWDEAYAYIISANAKNARRVAEYFAKAKGYRRVDNAVSVCGKKKQAKIRVLTKEGELITLRELYDRARKLSRYGGVLALSDSKEDILKHFAHEIYTGLSWRWRV